MLSKAFQFPERDRDMDTHIRLMSLGCLVLLLGFLYGSYALISHNVLIKMNVINKEGSYIGIVLPNSFEMSPLLQSPAFVVDHKLTYLDCLELYLIMLTS
ncbi:hypothetical protein CsSME_00028429 [Camellia sinensis var. sinensis]